MAEYDDPTVYELTPSVPKGTKVVCVDDDWGELTAITKGEIYSVDHFEKIGRNDYVHVKPKFGYVIGGWLLNRFEIVGE